MRTLGLQWGAKKPSRAVMPQWMACTFAGRAARWPTLALTHETGAQQW